jgi:hypothetical protein
VATENLEELRIHGVAGTPPETLLGLSADLVEPPADDCRRARSRSDIEIFRPPGFAHEVRAYSWGSLTSGSAKTALWILLLPYMLVNVAGWMALPMDSDPPTLPERPRRSTDVVPAARIGAVRLNAFLVRIAGLLVTTIFGLFAFLALGDLVGFQWQAEDRSWAPGAGLALSAALVFFVFWLTRVRLRDDARFEHPWEDDADPVGYALLHKSQAEMWNRPGIIVRLARLHLAWSGGVLAVIGALINVEARADPAPIDRLLIILAALACLIAAGLLSVISLGTGHSLARLNGWIRTLSPVFSLAVVGLAAVRLAGVSDIDGAIASPNLPYIRGAGELVGVALLVVVLVAFVVGMAKRLRDETPRGSQWHQPAILFLAGGVGTVMGAGFSLYLERQVEGWCKCVLVEGVVVDWLALVFLWGITVVLWMSCVRWVLAWRKLDRNAPQRLMMALATVTENPSRVSVWLAWVGALSITGPLLTEVMWGLPAPGDLPTWVRWASTSALVLVGGLFAIPIVGQLTRPWLRLVAGVSIVAVVTAITWLMFQTSWQLRLGGFLLPPRNLLELAQLVALLLPITLMLTRIAAGLRKREVRKGVGTLWDVGAFFPRWFHPFAPPTYSDRAVTDLTNRLRDRSDHAPLVLAPHSQGSVIAVASIAATDPTKTTRLAMLSYGAPLGRLYANAFPAVFSERLLTSVFERLRTTQTEVRWRNLFRASDPIGGPILRAPPGLRQSWAAPNKVDIGPITDSCGRQHSFYHLEREYGVALEELAAMLRVGDVKEEP